MEKIYFIIAIVSYGLFFVRTLMSLFGGDLEVDADLDVSDIVSFKGATHFLMGASGWLSLRSLLSHVMWYDFIIAFVIGIIFIICLFFVYKLFSKLENKPKILQGKELIGKYAVVYMYNGIDEKGNYKFTITVNHGNGTIELPALSNWRFTTGDYVTIKNFINNNYII